MVVLESFENIPHGSEQFPEGFIEHRGALILNRTDARIIVGLTNDSDIALREEIGQFFQFQGIDDLSLNFELISNADLARFIHKKIREELHDQSGRAQLSEQNAVDKLANNAPIINLVNGIILDAINAEASDIHIERGKNNASVRYRLDGVLIKDRDIPDGLYPSITARIKIMAGLNIMEQRRPQDGRLSVTLSAYSLDLRISSVPTAHGESLVLRILNLNSSPRTLNEIGFSDPQLHLLKNTIHNPQGFILITGPTGSGKTTTLNALLTEINDGSKKIISIEDPVEFNIDGVDQIQTHDEIGLSFSKILRRILRQDPDVIMVGEIRDEETAQLAMRAAMTGHMVLSSLHTNNAIASIQRLVNIGVDPYLIAGMLQTIIAQRLVRKLCVHCRRPVQS
ncbi:MAG: GspE/PulE family protein, partial [Salinispira sp.]